MTAWGATVNLCAGQVGPDSNRQEVPASPGNKLSGSTRDLAAPETITPLPASNKRPVLIYYANESAPNDVEKLNTETLIEWLKSASEPVIRQLGWKLEYHTALLPFVIDCEIATLSGVDGGGAGADFDLVVFTNRLAREGRFLYFSGETTRKLVVAEFSLPKFDEPAAASNPLSQESAFEAALKAVAGRFDPTRHEFALITKSHGSASHALTTSTSVQTSQVDRKEILSALAESAKKREIEFVKSAKALTIGGAALPTDGDGNRLLVYRGFGYWEAHGPAHLRAIDKIVVVDALGTPFRTADGRRLLVDQGVLKLETNSEPVRYSDGAPVVIAGVASINRRLAPWNWKQIDVVPEGKNAIAHADIAAKLARVRELPPNDEQAGEAKYLPLTQSAAAVAKVRMKQVAEAASTWGEIELAEPRFGRFATFTDTKSADSNKRRSRWIVVVDSEPLPKSATVKSTSVEGPAEIKKLIADLAMQKLPFTYAGERLNGLLDDLKQSDPILDNNMKQNDPILDKMGTDPILDKMGHDPILEKMGHDPILDKDGDLASAGTAVKLVGTTKDRYFEVLKQRAEAGMTFRLVFVESCRSSPTPEQLQVLRAGATPIERIWASDSQGLDFQTVDYGALVRRTRGGEGLIRALDAELQHRFAEQHRR
jgi:hypothetical protein